ncbi:MAG: N-6 DNA methylase [Saprospiraceae bacterium]|nr:N-6 DNA methylase [Saprospiraceae bacterium]
MFEEAVEELGYNASGSLRSTSEADLQPNFEDLSSISEWLSLGKAKRLNAHYVYFRRFDDRPSQPIVYIYNFAEGIPDDTKLGEVQRDIWSSGEVPCAFIFTKDSVRIINTTCQPTQNGEELEPVDLIGLAHEINDEIRKRFISYQLDSGEFWHEEARKFDSTRSAHKTLLKKLRVVRERFLEAKALPGNLVNRLLIQCVLIRFLEEKKDFDEHGNLRQVFPPDFFQRISQANNFREALEKGTFTEVFKYLNAKDRLNGQIFKWKKEEEELLLKIPTHNLVDWLYETSKDENSQLAFWDLYSFRFLPVEVISSIYEALFTTDKSVKEEGMVYTPPHLAAFLVDESMPLSDWKGKTNFKVLDPSCGSGVFLVLAFKRLVHWWRLENGGKAPHVIDLMGILSKSIMGIDKEPNAVLLTRFSLCLAVSDMLTPPEVYDDLHFPELKEELVESDFFKWFEDNKETAEFDLVIGNPPFVQAHKELPSWKELSKVAIPQKQIALYFLSAGMHLVKDKGLLCVLLKSSSLLYTSTGNIFRKHFFEKYNVRQIIDFTLLARNHVLWEVGEPDTTAIFVSKEAPNIQKSILHLVVKRTPANSLKRYFEIDAYDYHWVPYVAALQDDFVWKCNLLGGGRIYGLVKILKTFPRLLDFVNRKKWNIGEGYRKILATKSPQNQRNF